jgi:gliding motility-associated lipoprotein GldD
MKRLYLDNIQKKKMLIFFFSAILTAFSACKEDYTPKPRGFMKVEYPPKIYTRFETDAPFSFDYPEYARVVSDTSLNTEKYWYNIEFPVFDGTIYLSYKSVNDNISAFIEDSRTLAYKHTIKAEAIEESIISKPTERVYGLLYDFSGNTATSLQFFLTDSSRHFLRGSLYFNTTPRKDSLAPIIGFIREDVLQMIESFEWKDSQERNFESKQKKN